MPNDDDFEVAGLNAVKYFNLDVDSLAQTLQKCCKDPVILERLYATCYMLSKFSCSNFIQSYLHVYEQVVMRPSVNGGKI